MWNKFDARMGSECLHAVPVGCASIVCAVWVTDAAKIQLLCKALPASHSEVAVAVCIFFGSGANEVLCPQFIQLSNLGASFSGGL